MSGAERPPVIAIVGKKNSGKTSLVVALAAELRARGLRVASVKHAHHAFEVDREGSDSWRHFNEGGVEAVLLVAAGKMALVSRLAEEPRDAEELIDRFFAGQGLDLVLVEGYKHGGLPKVEIHRAGIHPESIYASSDAVAAALFLAVVTDDPALVTSCPTISLDPEGPNGSHVAAIADLLLDLYPKQGDAR
jgi:molybdopterin-guanine dinucleotide biosynthesis protein MobB